jgi:hypothetical protein
MYILQWDGDNLMVSCMFVLLIALLLCVNRTMRLPSGFGLLAAVL